MKNPNKDLITELEEIPNIGKVISSKLRLIGIEKPKDLLGNDPIKLYKQLCEKENKKIDPCVIDVFISAIDFMEGGEAKPWWEFTKRRKEMLGN